MNTSTRRNRIAVAIASTVTLVPIGGADASPSRPSAVLVDPGEVNGGGMVEFARFTGQYSWSADGFASSTGSGTLDIIYPTGTTIAAAYLTMPSSAAPTEDAPPAEPVSPPATLNGTTVTFTHRAYEETEGLEWSNRFADVTDIVADFLAGRTPGTTVSIPATHPTSKGSYNQFDITGLALTVVFADPSAVAFTTVFHFGHSRTSGDQYTVEVNPIETIPPIVGLSLGIGWSAQSGAHVDDTTEGYSTVELQTSSDTERTLVSDIAGGCDDSVGYPTCNPFITVGGVGDDPANPDGTWVNSRSDDELYNLAEFLEVGDDSFTLSTVNPRGDDTIFQAIFGIPALPDVAVTFDANDGTGSMAPQLGYNERPLDANAFTRDGYLFAGWNTEPDGSGTAYADTADFPFDVATTLYAQWTPVPTTIAPTTSTPIEGVLPPTGSNNGWLLAGAALLVLAGAGLARRRSA